MCEHKNGMNSGAHLDLASFRVSKVHAQAQSKYSVCTWTKTNRMHAPAYIKIRYVWVLSCMIHALRVLCAGVCNSILWHGAGCVHNCEGME